MLELQIGTVGFVSSFVKYKVTVRGSLNKRLRNQEQSQAVEYCGVFFHQFFLCSL